MTMKQLNCSKCGETCVLTKEIYKGKSEFGFTIPTEVYRCKSCGERHVICPDCNGDKFEIHNERDYHDCSTCNGMGVIQIGK